jgi:putative transposase
MLFPGHSPSRVYADAQPLTICASPGRAEYNNDWLIRTQVGYVVEVVKRPAGSVGFVKQPQRYVVERTFAWLGRYRRHSRDYERYTRSSEAMVQASSIHRMLRLLKKDETRKPVAFKYRELQEKVTG